MQLTRDMRPTALGTQVGQCQVRVEAVEGQHRQECRPGSPILQPIVEERVVWLGHDLTDDDVVGADEVEEFLARHARRRIDVEGQNLNVGSHG